MDRPKTPDRRWSKAAIVEVSILALLALIAAAGIAATLWPGAFG